MSFQSDLKEGEASEKKFLKILKSRGLDASRNKATTLKGMRAYDIKIKNSEDTYEIKKDRRHVDTGNVYLEHKALLRSEATFVTYELADGFYTATRALCIRLIASEAFKLVRGGDFRDSGTLIPVEVFKDIFKKEKLAKKPKQIRKQNNNLSRRKISLKA